MGPGSHKIEIGDGVVAIVRAEPGRLGQRRFQTEGAAVIGTQITREIGRRIAETSNINVDDFRFVTYPNPVANWLNVLYRLPEPMMGR